MFPSLSDINQLFPSLVIIAGCCGALMVLAYRAKAPSLVYVAIFVVVVGQYLVITHVFPYFSTVVAEGAGAVLIGTGCSGLTWRIKNRKQHGNVGLIATLTVLCFIVLILGTFGQVRQVIVDAPTAQSPLFSPTDTPSVSLPAPTVPGVKPTATRSSSSPGGGTGGSGTGGSGTGGGGTGGGGTGGSGTLPPTATPTWPPLPPAPTATPTPKPLAVGVQGASANITSTSPPSSCVVTVQISGTISTNSGQGTIHYYWHRSDGSNTPSDSFSATTGKSSYGVSDTWYPQVSGTPSTYWDQLIVTSPTVVHSNQASTNLTC